MANSSESLETFNFFTSLLDIIEIKDYNRNLAETVEAGTMQDFIKNPQKSRNLLKKAVGLENVDKVEMALKIMNLGLGFAAANPSQALVSPISSVNSTSPKHLGYMVKVYKWPLDIGEIGRRIIESKPGTKIKLWHVGIAVFNTLHHYGTHGLVQQLEFKNTFIEDMKEKFFITSKTRHDFDVWLRAEAANKFTAANYHFANQNCIDFASQLFDFLFGQGEYFKNEDDSVKGLQDWLKTESKIVEVGRQVEEMYKTGMDKLVVSSSAICCSSFSSSSSRGKGSTDVKEALEETLKVVDEFKNIILSGTGGLYEYDEYTGGVTKLDSTAS